MWNLRKYHNKIHVRFLCAFTTENESKWWQPKSLFAGGISANCGLKKKHVRPFFRPMTGWLVWYLSHTEFFLIGLSIMCTQQNLKRLYEYCSSRGSLYYPLLLNTALRIFLVPTQSTSGGRLSPCPFWAVDSEDARASDDLQIPAVLQRAQHSLRPTGCSPGAHSKHLHGCN